MWFMGKQNKISNTRSRMQYYIYCRTKTLPSYRAYYFMMAFFVLVIFCTNYSYRTDTSIEPYPSFCGLAQPRRNEIVICDQSIWCTYKPRLLLTRNGVFELHQDQLSNSLHDCNHFLYGYVDADVSTGRRYNNY